MKSKLKLLFVALGVLVFVSACGNTTNEEQPETVQNVKQEDVKSEDQQSSTNNPNSNDIFRKGVFIDFENVDNPLLNEQIKEGLKKTLEAQVNGDEDVFRATFKTPDTGDAYLGVIGNYRFTDIGNVQEDTTKNQILVEVDAELARETSIDDVALTYYYATDADGNWSLVAID
ncbi:hypothetical protein [Paenibacillus xylanilyticus]|uniref:Lipoprotein n=1 Tax=Paenibacillus xylanilyticus TaxID=248903 RepID=A0A7Y6BSG5_9BACL|nr:hypothetical protein [Paenibacillus xylanilyticus]NUU73956.1 hypothetical protein [Paenibacillus xylanilyticus]